MKIAYLILCHIDPKHIRRLVQKITDGTENEAFVHVDKKSNISPFKAELENCTQVHFLENRIKISWGRLSEN